MSDTPRNDACKWTPITELVTLSCQLERELAEAKADDALNTRILSQHAEQITELQEDRRELEAQLTAHKAALEKCGNILEEIVSTPFYQRTCRGGEMERLMNQAIEALGGKA